MDKLSERLTTAELQKNNLRETLTRLQDHSSSLLVFSLQWKDLEAHYESLRNVLSQREKEVCAQEQSLQCRLRCFEKQCHEFEVKRSELGILDESMKVLRKEFEVAECRFSQRARLEFEAIGREIGEELDVLEDVRREIAEKLVETERRERHVERGFEDIDRKVEKRVKELEELWSETEKREREIERRSRELDKKEKGLEELRRRIEPREKELECRDRESKKKAKELEELRRRIEPREREIECRNRQLKKKEKDLEELRRRYELREKEIKCRDWELEKKEKELEELRRRIEMREEETDPKDRGFGVRCQEHEEKVVKLEERIREVERRDRESEIKYEVQFKMLEIMKKEVEEKMENVRLEEEKLKTWCGEIESQEKKLDKRCKEVDATERRLQGLAEELKSGERELQERIKVAKLEEQMLKERLDKFDLEKREFEERFKDGIVRERKLFEEIKLLEIREKQNHDLNVAKNRLNIAALAMLRSEEPRKRRANNAAGVVAQTCVVMDGKELQIFLNELREEHNVKRDTASALLRFCSDPAKLILDALVGFYPPHLKYGDCEFEASVVRNTCLLLLDQLMEMDPVIKPHVKGEAMKLSFDWITQMKVDSEDSMEVVAFLELVCAYGLADAFDANELLDYAETVAYSRQIPKLHQALGLAGRIPS